MSTAQKATLYFCAIREYSAIHTFSGNKKAQAFQLQEMGVEGTGSLEHGDASGEIFWMEYPFPFLTHYYSTFPLDEPERAKPPAFVDISSPGAPGAGGGKLPALPPDAHPDYPHPPALQGASDEELRDQF